MQFRTMILALLPMALASPTPNPGAEAVNKLTKRAETCAILGTNVNCRYHPNTSSKVITQFSKGSQYFTCTQWGTCVNGNCRWDYAQNYDCFVSAYYTGHNCNEKTLPICPFSLLAADGESDSVDADADADVEAKLKE